jgi:hypothetical protein
VSPAENIFSTETAAVGDTFTVNISAADWGDPGAFSYELKLYWDPALLEATELVVPDDHFLAPEAGGTFILVESTFDNAAGMASVAGTRLAPEPGATGDGVFATITFQITAAPSLAVPVSCALDVADVIVTDPDAVPYPEGDYDLEDGYYEFAAPAPPTPYLAVEPNYVSAEEVGDEVVVNVTIHDVTEEWRLVGFEWKLRFNTSILDVASVTEGDYLASEAEKASAETGDDYGTYFHAIPEADYVISFSLYFKTPWPPELFPGHFEEGGTLATIVFSATYKPTLVDMVASSDLTLADVLLVDVDANEVPYERLEHGFYTIAVAPPPWLSVEPKEYLAEELGEQFDLNVFINELEATWMMVGAEFKVRYNTTLLSVVNITEGGFMEFFAGLAGTDIFFQAYVEEDYGLIGIMILPLDNGTWPGPFPDTEDYGAPGDFAALTFEAIFQHEELDLSSIIWLDEIVLANTKADLIPYDAEKTAPEGLCEYTITRAIPPFVFEGMIDLMTQYPDPWNGRGIGAASDAFPPQGVAELRATVTYRGDVVPGKPVSYAVTSPSGAVFYSTNFTQADGTAVFEYSIPSSEQHFGLWTVRASVDLAGTVVSDTLYFLMGWLVEVVKVEAPEIAYKNETMNLNVTLSRICMQDPREIMNAILRSSSGEAIEDNDLLLYITVTDELDQPVATVSLNTSMIAESSVYDLDAFVGAVGSQWDDRVTLISTDYPELMNVVMNGIPISHAAFSGVATIRANVLTDYPGVAYCPEEWGSVLFHEFHSS